MENKLIVKAKEVNDVLTLIQNKGLIACQKQIIFEEAKKKGYPEEKVKIILEQMLENGDAFESEQVVFLLNDWILTKLKCLLNEEPIGKLLFNFEKTDLSFFIPITNYNYIKRNPNANDTKLLIQQIKEDVKLRLNEELYKWLNSKKLLTKTKSDDYNFVFSSEINQNSLFIPSLKNRYLLSKDIKVSLELCLFAVNTNECIEQIFLKVDVGVKNE